MKALPIVLLAACASAPPPKSDPTSRGLHADEHLAEARDHQRRADELARFPEMRRNDVGRFDDPNTGLWYRAFDQTTDQQRLAETHRSEAAQIQATFDKACENVQPDHIRLSPLQRYGIGGMNTNDGVVVFLPVEAGPPDRLLAELECHRAWMMLSPANMESCPLDLPGLRVQARGDKTGISIELRVTSPQLVPELQRRTARDLEVSQHRKVSERE